ncbi:MAG: hypothetical protein KDC91_01160 [Flavobacteriaceae bacterium]|nr:hypothetical protein [Flavobacteriaceae bacterium]
MVTKTLTCILLLFPLIGFSQVGIGTTTVSNAAALTVEAQNPSGGFGGFLMPIVTEAQQASIPVSTIDYSDDGLLVYVSDPVTGKQCLEIYDAYQQVWQSITCPSECDDVLYEEDFNSYTNGTGITGASSTNGDYPSSVTKWTLSSYSTSGNGSLAYPGSLADASDYAIVNGSRLELRDTNGPLLFQTQAININGYSDVFIQMDISETGDMEYFSAQHFDDFNCGSETQGNDYVDIEYSTNSGSTYTEVANYSGLGTTNHTLHNNLSGTVGFVLSGITGTSLIIRIRFQNWASSEYYYLDNILVSCN